MFIMKQPVSLQSRDIEQLLGKLSEFVIDAGKCFGPPPPGETVLQNGDPAAERLLLWSRHCATRKTPPSS
jgi:hypothetical protein